MLNEEKLLEHCLAMLMPHVDQVVVVDGGPSGPSDDDTREIAMAAPNGDKLNYINGQYEEDGIYDKMAQFQAALDLCRHDVIMYITADRLISNLECAADIIRQSDNIGLFYSREMDFWLDAKHGRTGEDGITAFRTGLLAVDRTMVTDIGPSGYVKIGDEVPERLYIDGACLYHLGWIRPFRQQVEKHVKHINWGLHDEIGEKLIEEGPRAVEAWAIHHVFRYRDSKSIELCFEPPEAIKPWLTMKYNDGFDEYSKDYEVRYQEEFYYGVNSVCPLELIKYA